ncbi:hypothetical protein BV898_14821 [Hypsibius exemplaris]|uniref:C2H2-type domain-containing protein n=1 Tax=Hypsibius exemplaris TaxID=2072580 RepID=A0A9X6RJV3_HYPEX|nr:hypothetical protein BV898_14821 [Hypsibius exemplaris]
MLLKPFDPSSKYAALPFDYYCPFLRKGGKLNRMVCKTCGAYFATQVACKNHHCAPDDQEEDYEDMSDDDEVATYVPAYLDIPIISDLMDWLRSDLVEDRPDLE